MAGHGPSRVLLVLGPSGVGKSTLGDWLAEDLDLVRLELDPWPEPVWRSDVASAREALLSRGDAGPLVALLTRLAGEAGRAGGVATLCGGAVLPLRRLLRLRRLGAQAVVLYASERECLSSFLAREAVNGRGLDEAYWRRHRDPSFAAHGSMRYLPWRLLAFDRGARRSRADLVAVVARRLRR